MRETYQNLLFGLSLKKKADVIIFLPTSAAIPLTFKMGLKNQEAPEGGNVCLRCELSRASVPVQWWKGEDQLSHGGRFQMSQKGKTAEMTIRSIQPEDVGEYSCVFGGQKTTAEVNVRGVWILLLCVTKQ